MDPITDDHTEPPPLPVRNRKKNGKVVKPRSRLMIFLEMAINVLAALAGLVLLVCTVVLAAMLATETEFTDSDTGPTDTGTTVNILKGPIPSILVVRFTS